MANYFKMLENYHKNINESILLEYDRKDMKRIYGTDLTTKFINLRSRLQAPQNDLNYWVQLASQPGHEGDLATLIQQWESGEVTSKTQKDKEEKMEGADLIFSNNAWKVYFISTYKAAAKYGSGTTWCITGRYHGAESHGEYYFNSYIRDRRLDNGEGKPGYYFLFYLKARDQTTGDYLKYCIGRSRNRIEFMYNGMQDREISHTGIPCPAEDAIQMIPGIQIPYKVQYYITDGVVTSADDGLRSRYGNEDVVITGANSIANRVFQDCLSIKNLTIKGDCSTIGTGAFLGCENLDNIILEEGVTTLGKGCFCECGCGSNLKVSITSTITEIPRLCFATSSRHTLSIVSGVNITHIADDAFKGVKHIIINNRTDVWDEFSANHPEITLEVTNE